MLGTVLVISGALAISLLGGLIAHPGGHGVTGPGGYRWKGPAAS